MKKFVASIALLALASSARADFVFTFDENGNGTLNGASLPGALAADPSNGGNPALTYLLPAGILFGPGDLLVNEPTGGLTDILRFTNASGQLSGTGAVDRVIFYSDVEAGERPDLADTGIPTNGGGEAIYGPVTEVGPEGANGFFFQGVGANYTGISDSPVPEPATLTLLGIGIAGLAGYGWRQRRKAPI